MISSIVCSGLGDEKSDRTIRLLMTRCPNCGKLFPVKKDYSETEIMLAECTECGFVKNCGNPNKGVSP